MSEKDVLKYLANQSAASPKSESKQAVRPTKTRRSRPGPEETFKDFSATHLFCPNCRQAMPVREKLLLYLPTGNLYGYCCERCGASVGTRNAGI